MGCCIRKRTSSDEDEASRLIVNAQSASDRSTQEKHGDAPSTADTSVKPLVPIPGSVGEERDLRAAQDSPEAKTPGVFKAGDRVVVDGAVGVINSGPDEDEEYLVDWITGETSSFHTAAAIRHECEVLRERSQEQTDHAARSSAEEAGVEVESVGEELEKRVDASSSPKPQEPPLEEPPAAPQCGGATPSAGEVEDACADSTWDKMIERGQVRPDLSWFEAAAANEVQTLSWLLSSRTTPRELLDLRNEEKSTALHLAARAGALETCELLLRRKADPNVQDKVRSVPLHLAAVGGHVEATRMLLDPSKLWTQDVGAVEGETSSVDSWPGVTAADLWRRTPLHKAAEGGSPEVVALLLDARSKVDQSDREGNTALHFAVVGGHDQVVELMLGRADAKPPIDATNKEDYSPLDLCVLHRRGRSGDALVAVGAKLCKDVRKKPPTLFNAIRDDLPFLCTYIMKSAPPIGAASLKQQFAAADDDGRSPLGLAARSGSVEVARRLLGGRADVEALQPIGTRPIHEAAAAGNCEMLAALMESQAAVGAMDKEGQTALFHAAACGQVSACEWILDNARGDRSRADVLTVCDHRERTALHAAAERGQVSACSMLLGFAASEGVELLHAEDWEGFTAAHLAVQKGQAETCRFLVADKATVYAALDYGITTLQSAAEGGHVEVLKLLLDELMAGTNPDAPAVPEAFDARRVSDGRSAWLVAASGGHVECCQTLWSLNSSPSMGQSVDRDGRDALMLAARGGHVGVCSWLLEIGANNCGLAVSDACGWTALHVAASEGQKNAVQWLVNARADIKAEDEDGFTAWDWANRRGHLATEAFLRDAMKDAVGV